MRRAGIPLAALLATAPAVTAQVQPPATPAAGQRVPIPGGGTPVTAQPGGVPIAPAAGAPVQLDAALIGHLQAWEAVMKGTTNFYTQCTMTKRNLITKKESQYAGVIMCVKPNLARMRIDEKPPQGQKPDPNSYLAYICTGLAVYEYDAAQKQVTEYALPNGGVGDNLLLTFMSGAMKANDIIQRFDMKLTKEDQNYVYLDIFPREVRDKAEFEKLTLVLFGRNVPTMAYLPAMVVMRKNNGQEEEVWEFSQPRANVEGVKLEHFRYVPPEKDWKVQRAQAPAAPPAQPRVVRPQGTP